MAERAGDVEPPSLNEEEYSKWLQRRNRARKEDDLSYKDEYLAYCMYVRAGYTMSFVESIVGTSNGRMSDIHNAWSNVLESLLLAMFPPPTRSQMYRAYPQRNIEADGEARNFLNLDATELFCQQSSNNNVASSTHSDYKKHTLSNFLRLVILLFVFGTDAYQMAILARYPTLLQQRILKFYAKFHLPTQSRLIKASSLITKRHTKAPSMIVQQNV
jgi:hypothetical protein